MDYDGSIELSYDLMIQINKTKQKRNYMNLQIPNLS